MDADAEKLVQEVTDLLMSKGCAVTKPAMLDLAIYILEREKKVITDLQEK